MQATRSVGFNGPEPIKFTEMLAYMQMFGIDDPCERQFFLKRIRMIDRIYMDLQKQGKPDGQHVQSRG